MFVYIKAQHLLHLQGTIGLFCMSKSPETSLKHCICHLHGRKEELACLWYINPMALQTAFSTLLLLYIAELHIYVCTYVCECKHAISISINIYGSLGFLVVHCFWRACSCIRGRAVGVPEGGLHVQHDPALEHLRHQGALRDPPVREVWPCSHI